MNLNANHKTILDNKMKKWSFNFEEEAPLSAHKSIQASKSTQPSTIGKLDQNDFESSEHVS